MCVVAGGLRVIFKPPIIPRRVRAEGGTEYRLYFLDGLGHIQKSHEFEVKNDGVAIKICDAWREGHGRMELWQRGRIVKRWAKDED
jgi:hypothetical protein